MNYELCGYTTLPMTKNSETYHCLWVKLVNPIRIPKTVNYIFNIWPRKYIHRDITYVHINA